MHSSDPTSRFASLFLRLALSILILCIGASAAGVIDPGFNASVQRDLYGLVETSATQSDGKILIAGRFWAVNGVAAYNIARLNPDGSIDPTFRPPTFYASFNNDAIYALAVQSTGKILVGGLFDGTSAGPGPTLRRLNPDGSVDMTFTAVNFPVSSVNTVYSIRVLSDDKFYIGGNFNYQGRGSLVRLNADGSTDASFAPGFSQDIRAMHIQPDGKILVGGRTSTNTGFLNRFIPDGTLDPAFAAVTLSQQALVIKQQPDAKILVGGEFTLVNSQEYARVARFNTDGTRDNAFNALNTNTNGAVADIEVRGDGKILVGGGFTVFNGLAKPKVVLLNSTDGSVDDVFTASLENAPKVTVLEILANGKIIAAYSRVAIGEWGGIAMLNANGATDTSVKYDVGRDFVAYRVARQLDGKIIVGGVFSVANGTPRSSLARFNLDGTLDTTFVPPSSVQIVSSLAIQPDGKVLIGSNGCCQPGGVVRLNSDGSLDPSFSTTVSGNVSDIDVFPNGQILVGGSFPASVGLVKLNQNGTVASTYPSLQPMLNILRVMIRPDGKIYVSGSFSSIGGQPRGSIARINADETLDQTFVSPATPNVLVHDFDIQPDGKVVVAGQFLALGGNTSQRNIGRLNSDGTLDASFAQATDGALFTVRVQPDGKIVAGGSMANVAAAFRPGLVRLNPNGSVDQSFTATTNSHVHRVIQQPDGKLIAVGAFTRVSGVSRLCVVRLLTTTGTLFDYDGDGKSDVSVFRPSENKWYVFRSSDSTVLERTFAIAGDVIAPADFDGDGKVDLAIFRPSSGDWWYLASTDGSQRSVHWGASGDIPRPSDFDADGKADFIIFRPAENNWYRFGSTGVVSIVNFGLAGDKPVIGDFDGDGKSDPAIFRPSTGDWWYRSSINDAQIATHFGISTDTPTQADFDGDSKTDFAVFRASTGTWYILNSGSGQTTIVNFGLAEDKPVAADYDGDGRADIAVFRPSSGTWYLLRSTAGFAAFQFGISTDQPTPNGFVP